MKVGSFKQLKREKLFFEETGKKWKKGRNSERELIKLELRRVRRARRKESNVSHSS